MYFEDGKLSPITNMPFLFEDQLGSASELSPGDCDTPAIALALGLIDMVESKIRVGDVLRFAGVGHRKTI